MGNLNEEDINTKQTREAVNVEISRDVHLGSGRRTFYQQFQ
jgi:hypothetical protein